jgi:hypothetical protein
VTEVAEARGLIPDVRIGREAQTEGPSVTIED